MHIMLTGRKYVIRGASLAAPAVPSVRLTLPVQCSLTAVVCGNY
ncbi:hypothetical protein EPYR_00881 [Erwinia pyrifoliae DSM 12163]|nr:hypothetical protein EJP617_02690 [Erwinia sp. Ejp617]CAY73261.1 hypothetical protein EPYR_00881 [Erwinia pyrifoliae DSM 12163]